MRRGPRPPAPRRRIRRRRSSRPQPSSRRSRSCPPAGAGGSRGGALRRQEAAGVGDAGSAGEARSASARRTALRSPPRRRSGERVEHVVGAPPGWKSVVEDAYRRVSPRAAAPSGVTNLYPTTSSPFTAPMRWRAASRSLASWPGTPSSRSVLAPFLASLETTADGCDGFVLRCMTHLFRSPLARASGSRQGEHAAGRSFRPID